jgi:ATP-dependent Clp protease ATP-binding subunit ClpA
MRLLHRRRSGPRATIARLAAEPYLAGGAAEARSLGHNSVGTEHVLLLLIRNPDGGATAVLRQLGVSADAVDEALALLEESPRECPADPPEAELTTPAPLLHSSRSRPPSRRRRRALTRAARVHALPPRNGLLVRRISSERPTESAKPQRR